MAGGLILMSWKDLWMKPGPTVFHVLCVLLILAIQQVHVMPEILCFNGPLKYRQVLLFIIISTVIVNF